MKRVLIPNIDDDDGDGLPDFGADVHDAAVDNELLPVDLGSDAGLPDGATLRIEVPKPWVPFIRILRLDPSDGMFRPVPRPVRLSADEIGRGRVSLAIEASAFAGPGRPREFSVVFRFEKNDGSAITEQTVACAVAPFMMSSCLDPASIVHVVATKITATFVNGLRPLVEAAGARLLALEDPAIPEHDIWFQDTTEIGYAVAGERLMRVALHGNRGRELDDVVARAFLGEGSGVVHPGGFRGKAAEWIDWFGNLEVSPPLVAGNRVFPHGRIYAGTQGVRAMHPEVVDFLEAQGMQSPVLWLDTSWLIIGHVDETVSWVPSDVGRPFRMLLPSPRLAVAILRRAEQAAPGCLLNRGTRRADSQKDDFCDTPVEAVLGDPALMADQEYVQKKIDGVRRTLQTELGVADADIVEIPVLFNSWPGRFAGRYGALTPNMVNSLQVGKTLILTDPHGPLVGGRDVLLQAVKDSLEPLGCRVVAVDDFYPYHRYGGEVHCGTNATRHPPVTR